MQSEDTNISADKTLIKPGGSTYALFRDASVNSMIHTRQRASLYAGSDAWHATGNGVLRNCASGRASRLLPSPSRVRRRKRIGSEAASLSAGPRSRTMVVVSLVALGKLRDLSAWKLQKTTLMKRNHPPSPPAPPT